MTKDDSLHEWRRGWTVVLAACLGTGTGYAMFLMTAGMFIKPMQEEFGWTMSALSIGPIVLLLGALLSPVAGMIVDRFGTRRVALLGMALSALAYCYMAMMPKSYVGFYLAAAIMGLISPLSHPIVFTRGVAAWFDKSLGMAFGVTLSGVSLLSMICLPVIGYLIESFGWRAGYYGLAGIVTLLGFVPVLLLFRERALPQSMENGEMVVEGEPFSVAIRDPRFWIFATAFSLAAISMGGFMSHSQPMLRLHGLSAVQAGGVGMIFALSMFLGRLAVGFCLDRYWPPMVAIVVLAISGGGALALGFGDASLGVGGIAIALFLIGLAQGSEADLVAFFTRRLFGMRAYSTLFGIQAMTTAFGMSGGGLAFAQIADHRHSYALASIGAGLIFWLAAAMVLAGGRLERSFQQRQVATKAMGATS